MPLPIPNTTLLDDYDPTTTFAGNDRIAWGFFTVANQPAFVQLLEGQPGQSHPQPEVYCPPATYPIAGGDRVIAGIRARNAVAGSPVQFFGSLFYPNEPGIQAGNPFTSTVSASGAITTTQSVRTLDITNTQVNGTGLGEVTLYSVDLAAGAMLAQNLLKLEIGGDLLYNNNLADTLTIRVYIGATIVLEDSFNSVQGALSALRQAWAMRIWVATQTLVTSPFVSLELDLADGQSAVVGGGELSSLNAGRRSGGTGIQNLPGAGVDMSLAQTISVRCFWSSASPNDSLRKQRGMATLWQVP